MIPDMFLMAVAVRFSGVYDSRVSSQQEESLVFCASIFTARSFLAASMAAMSFMSEYFIAYSPFSSKNSFMNICTKLFTNSFLRSRNTMRMASANTPATMNAPAA